ncbi:MAG TPA: hypothetical protein VMG12_05960 [Polyangiaceae bacterium]|nr:hypothetical protein [Polyangiaceae bacterium]
MSSSRSRGGFEPGTRRCVASVAWLLGVGVLSASCGLETIELRRQDDVADPVVPGSDEPMELASEPEPAASESDDGGPSVPRPSGPLPDSFEVTPPPVLPEKGCTAVDFLFVIDNSDSMDDEQENLTRSFPGFIEVVKERLQLRDFHIMVVGTGGDREDEDEPTLDPLDCEEVQGAGRRLSLDGDDCGIQGGLPYMTDEQENLEETFSCVARVGTDGSAIEEPMDAMLAATSVELNAAGRCNAGFLRDNAILVVTFITDEEDRRSRDEPEDWRALLLERKYDNPDALVMLGLVGDNNLDDGLLGGPCRALDADGAPRLQSFVNSLSGVLGSVCAPDYSPFFETAVSTIDTACDEFVPPVIF